MRFLEITAFDGNSLSGTGASPSRSMVSMSDNDIVISRMGALENGAKFDADGTADSDVMLGTVTARYRMAVRTGTLGLTGLTGQLGHFTGKLGHVGTLTGISRSGTDTTYQCSARCVQVIQEEIHYSDVSGGSGVGVAYVTVVWEKKSQWAAI